MTQERRDPSSRRGDLALDRRDRLEGRVAGVQELLAGREVPTLGVEGLGGLGPLLGGQALAGAEPVEADPDRRHACL